MEPERDQGDEGDVRDEVVVLEKAVDALGDGYGRGSETREEERREDGRDARRGAESIALERQGYEVSTDPDRLCQRYRCTDEDPEVSGQAGSRQQSVQRPERTPCVSLLGVAATEHDLARKDVRLLDRPNVDGEELPADRPSLVVLDGRELVRGEHSPDRDGDNEALDLETAELAGLASGGGPSGRGEEAWADGCREEDAGGEELDARSDDGCERGQATVGQAEGEERDERGQVAQE